MTPALKNILEAALMAAGMPLSLERMQSLFEETDVPSVQDLKQALTELKTDLLGRGIELVEVASGYRLQVRTEVAPWVARLWDERPQRYSRALLETLSLIAYRQPITRGDIEDVRGVVVSSGIMKTLLEREWVRVVGHRDVPGRPAMYATTKEFLDYFGLKSLDELPSLMEIRELDDANRKLELGEDAEARKEPARDYEFRSDEEVAQRGADVLSATEDDLAQAADIVARVERNLFHKEEDDTDAETGGVTDTGTAESTAEEKTEERAYTRSVGDLLDRLKSEKEAAEKEHRTEQSDEDDEAGQAGSAPADSEQTQAEGDGSDAADSAGHDVRQDMADSALTGSDAASSGDDDADTGEEEQTL
ncbi:MAG: SMC-Scp complex subunit ScpB [Pseudomonadota bacterium]|nr:SMC-Scp complex subunit ScpB [Pseudomonadota bacterium]